MKTSNIEVEKKVMVVLLQINMNKIFSMKINFKVSNRFKVLNYCFSRELY